MKLYLAVTPDIYELPLAVCDTPRELADFTGYTYGAVLCAITRQTQGNGKKYRILRIEVEDECT